MKSFVVKGVIGAAIAGCAMATGAEAGQVTFTKDVLPILQENCIECHRDRGANLGGMVAPMSFTSYQEARPWAKSMARAVSNRDMPPWDAAPQHAGVFEGERVLTQDEIDTIVAWVDQGARQGNPSDAPPPLEYPSVEGWVIGEPDLIVEMPEPFWVPDDLLDETVYFQDRLTAEEMPEDRWIKAVEFRPGSAAVHHIIARPFGGIAPGNVPNVYPDGYAELAKAEQPFMWNMHYHKEPGPETGMWDQSSFAVKLYPEGYTPDHVYTTVSCGPMDFAIPANDPDYAASKSFVFPKDALIARMMPHMHLRGTKVLYELKYPDGSEEVLLDVPKYDFNWQTVYRFKDPKPVPAGTEITVTGWWDNSADNPNNPDPNRTITWGEATHEEMLFGWITFTNVDEDASVRTGSASGD